MQLNFKTYGSGKPLIILHGLLGSLDNWQTLSKQYAAHYTVFVLDQRNHGKSPHTDAFSYDLLVEDLFTFMDDNFISSASIIGHSMGGKTAMYFALKYPEKVDKLIIADIAPMQYEEGHNTIFEALLSLDLENYDTREDIEAHLKIKIPEYGIRQFLMKGLTRNERKEFEWKFNLKSLWANYENILVGINTDEIFKGKVLFLKGAHSDYISKSSEIEILKYFPNAKISAIANAGHWLHAENPLDFYKETIHFLQNK
jgi:esterase